MSNLIHPSDNNLSPHHPPFDLDGPTVTSYLAQNPTISPHTAASRLFPKPCLLKRLWLRFTIKDNLYHRTGPTPEQIEIAFKSGKWSSDPNRPQRPSDLFLKMYADVLLCLQRDKLSGLVSPPLIGSCGVMPLTILSVIPDIMQHYYDCIVLAKREVLLATNYLQKSDSQRTICAALRELSKRVGERNQSEKVVVKLIYDRGNWKQAFKNHQPVKPHTSAWKEVGLPSLSEIPNLELEVINFHRVILGTFHAKFLVIDRTVALLNSNNIQDRPNVEMMIHLEGPIVDGFYDMFLISWNNAFKVPLPFLTSPTSSSLALTQSSTSARHQYKFGFENAFLRSIDVVRSAQDARATLIREAESDRIIASASQQQQQQEGSGMGLGIAAVVRDLMDERKRLRQPVQQDQQNQVVEGQSGIAEEARPPGPSASARLTNAVHQLIDEHRKAKRASNPNSTPTAPEPKPQSLSAPSRGTKISADSLTTTFVGSGCSDALTVAPEPARPTKVSIQLDPSHTGEHHQRHASHDTAATVGTHNEHRRQRSNGSKKQVKNRMRALSDALNAGTLRRAQANVSEDHPIADFQPHIIHTTHEEFPVAMVNRPPHGLPGHNDIRTPQNAAWLAGFRYAKKKVFIQTPTLNAAPVVRMCVETARRDVLVVLYLDLGFNDKGESIPFQGGTNQEVVIRMYKQLAKHKKQKYLRVYWYTGKDQIRPINAVLKSRNCHIKFMAIDDQVGIQGNGNQDTQSWFHSQEINVMIDSEKMVREWMHALVANQNTELYGQVGLDGIWRDEAGHTVDFYDQPKMAKAKKGSSSSEKVVAVVEPTDEESATVDDADESQPTYSTNITNAAETPMLSVEA
ncbi:hypothetical protein CROQUDRAFT_668840 [Cronartium quercuum f. sp. fusiforme G11]|uniref:PLD phosphodiesterase domain-containing protein n=1 Tax=Cronartium quercuum f. sp. fusiforme G11 TaxID=708437 RepID=A0A9P6NUW6_9BASI|nr:hypothetical protein CROQUDRAFT_668840 [Cronartium quercuum f. sp. fusiforme G11]